MQYYGTVESEK